MTCKIPEELLFQTILMNSEYRERMAGDSLRYFNFEGGDGSGPIYITEEDLERAAATDAIFIRKVNYGSNIREWLESRVLDEA